MSVHNIVEIQLIINDVKKKLISEFFEDLTLRHPMLGYKYNRYELIEKWEKRQ